MVEPSLTAPYSILVCLAKSSAESIGESILSTVRKAAKLAVYEEIIISVKNHHIPPTILVERALGISSDPVRQQHREHYELYIKIRHEKMMTTICNKNNHDTNNLYSTPGTLFIAGNVMETSKTLCNI